MRLSLCVVALSTVASSSAFAGIISDNGAPADAGTSTWFYAQTPQKSGLNTEFADDFVLAPGASTIRDIHWWGDAGFLQPTTELDTFTLTIYATAAVALAPGAVVTVATITHIERTFVDLTTSADTWFYSAQVEDIVLAPDTRYWLGISGDSGPGVDFPWSWRGTAQAVKNSGGFSRDFQTGQFGPAFGDAAFYLTDDVPAPGAMALVGVMGVVGANRRRRRMR